MEERGDKTRQKKEPEEENMKQELHEAQLQKQTIAFNGCGGQHEKQSAGLLQLFCR